MKKSLNDYSRKELLALPVRAWMNTSTYDSVLLLSTGKMHDSGWAMIAVIGVRCGVPVEIASKVSDDIEWITPKATEIGVYKVGQMRMDCAHKSRAMHVWSHDMHFLVGDALSSISITLVSGKRK